MITDHLIWNINQIRNKKKRLLQLGKMWESTSKSLPLIYFHMDFIHMSAHIYIRHNTHTHTSTMITNNNNVDKVSILLSPVVIQYQRNIQMLI